MKQKKRGRKKSWSPWPCVSLKYSICRILFWNGKGDDNEQCQWQQWKMNGARAWRDFFILQSIDYHNKWIVLCWLTLAQILHVRSLSQYYERWLYDDEICLRAQCKEDKESTFWHSLFEHWSTRLPCFALSIYPLRFLLFAFMSHGVVNIPEKALNCQWMHGEVDGWEAKIICCHF